MFRTDTFFSLVDYFLKLILIFKILKRHLLDYLRVKSIPFSKYNPFQTKEWVEHSLVHWKITEKLIHVQTFSWEVGDKHNSKMWSLALQKLPGGGKWLPHPVDCESFMEEAQIKGIECWEEYSSRPAESEELSVKHGTQKGLWWRGFHRWRREL